MNWVNPIISFSAYLGLFMALVIGLQKTNSARKNRYFALIIGLLSLQILKNVATDTLGFALHPAIYLALQGTCLFIGPTVYMYVRSMLPREPETALKAWPHFRLGIVYVIVITVVVLVFQNHESITDTITPLIAITLGYTVMFGQIFHVLWYFHRCLNRLNWYQVETQDHKLTSRLQWMKVSIWVMAAVIVLLIIPFLFVTAMGELTVLEYLKQAFLLAISFAINYSAIQSFNKPDVVLTVLAPSVSLPTEKASQWQQMTQDLNRLMDEQKPYLNGELKLDEMAALLTSSAADLSQFLNQQYGKNYKEFMNDFRVNEAKKLLSEVQETQDSIYGIALESGFNSKATFNRVFKQKTGLSPSEYRKQAITDRSTS